MLPQLLRFGADRVMMEERDNAGRGLHLFEDLLHPRRLAVRNDDLHRRIALHDGKADQGRTDEHVVVEPWGQDRRQRMPQRRRSARECDRLTGTTTAARERTTTPA